MIFSDFKERWYFLKSFGRKKIYIFVFISIGKIFFGDIFVRNCFKNSLMTKSSFFDSLPVSHFKNHSSIQNKISKTKEIIYNPENPILSKKQRKSFVIFRDPENPKFRTKKDEISKAKENLLKRIIGKKRSCEKSMMHKPMNETHDHTPPQHTST